MRQLPQHSRRTLLALALISITHTATAVELMEWNRAPLVIDLPLGQERLITLDRNVSVGLPGAIAKPDILRVQSAGGVLYLKADKAFDTQRVQLRDEATGELILVDLTAKSEASNEPIKVVVAGTSDVQANPDSTELTEATEPIKPSYADPLPVVLTRYAAQSLYAPLRTLEPIEGINRVAMRLPTTLETLIPALPVRAEPVAAWSLDGLQATAIRIHNRDPQRSFELDPRYLQGHLLAATFVHTTLGPKGQLDDNTTVILVTQGSLAERLSLPRIQRRVDALAIDGDN